MLRTRIIPCLLLQNNRLVKTTRFKCPKYIGDPVNTVRIFNELEVDELMFLDIFSSVQKKPINFKVLEAISSECFMPLSYGGGVRTFDDAKRVFEIGFEKIVINSHAFTDLRFIQKLSSYFGSQSIIGSIDVKTNFLGKSKVYSHHGRVNQRIEPTQWAKELENAGVGELLVTSIDHEGMWGGYHVGLINKIAESAQVPVIANGGASSSQDISQVVKKGMASAAAVGSMVVYQKKGMGVLVNFSNLGSLEV